MDLNLIRVFAAVYEEGAVTAAADRLNVAQPTVTQSLNRLRRATGEALFVKAGRGIVPTRAADRLYAEIGHFPAVMDSSVKSLTRFDPRSTTETFRVAMTDLGQEIFLPTLITALGEVAPKATLDVVSLDMGRASEDLKTGACDIAVASTVLPGRLKSVVIRPDVYFCVARKGRFEGSSPTMEELGYMPRIVARNSLGHTVVERTLPEPVEGSVFLPGFSSIPAILAATDLIAFVPQAVIKSWKSHYKIESWPLPKGVFSALVRAHMVKPASSAANSWFTDWAVTQMRNVPA